MREDGLVGRVAADLANPGDLDWGSTGQRYSNDRDLENGRNASTPRPGGRTSLGGSGGCGQSAASLAGPRSKMFAASRVYFFLLPLRMAETQTIVGTTKPRPREGVAESDGKRSMDWHFSLFEKYHPGARMLISLIFS